MKLKQWLSEHAETALSLLLMAVVAALAYGVAIPGLGFYRDDWYMIWAAQSQGAQGLIDLFKIDRPFIGYLYAFDYALLGPSPLNWHLYALLVKLLGGYALYWLLRQLWPERRLAAVFAVLCFLVYPGFYQQPNAALFINLLRSHAAALLSIALSVYALDARRAWARVGSALLAVALGVFYLLIYEAMIGLEAARLLVLAYALSRRRPAGDWKARALSLGKAAWPYLALAAGFVYWRLFVFESTRRSTDAGLLWERFSASPLRGALAVLVEAGKDMFDILVFAWTVPLYNNVTYSSYRDLAAALLVAGLALAAVAAFLWWRRARGLSGEARGVPEDYRHMLALGALVALVTVLPIVASGRDVSFSYQWDRYSVQSTLGVALVVAGFAFAFLRPSARSVVLLALIGSGVITQYQAALYYRELWTQQRELWWQLSWRVPAFAPGTTLIAAPPAGYRFLEEYEVWGPLNLVYNPGGAVPLSGQVPYDGIEADLAEGTVQNRRMREVLVVHDYGRVVVVSKPGLASCLHVLDGARPALPPEEEARMRAIAPYSDLSLVLAGAQASAPPSAVFGREPEHGWCYHYQKIDLARQRGDWDAAAQLAAEIERLGLEPADRSEWLPVIEAHLRAGDLDRARALAREVRSDRELRLALCAQMEAAETPPEGAGSPSVYEVLCRGGEE